MEKIKDFIGIFFISSIFNLILNLAFYGLTTLAEPTGSLLTFKGFLLIFFVTEFIWFILSFDILEFAEEIRNNKKRE